MTTPSGCSPQRYAEDHPVHGSAATEVLAAVAGALALSIDLAELTADDSDARQIGRQEWRTAEAWIGAITLVHAAAHDALPRDLHELLG